jgi:phosphatidylserine decarboxylase
MTTPTTFSGYGGWLPKSPAIYRNFINHLLKRALGRSDESTKHEPAVAAFGEVIQGDPVMKSLFDQIFLQVSEQNKVKDFEHLLSLLDCIIVTAPKYEVAKDSNGDVIDSEPIGVPMYLIFDLLSNTSAAYDLFRMKEFNRALKALLENWGKFLMEPGSNSTLNTTEEGWFGEAGIKNLEEHLGQYSFEQTYKCPDSAADDRGFTTWDAFFTRALNPGVRPIEPVPIILPPGGPRTAANSTPIYNACESTVLRIARKVKRHDQFWLKDQSYSLYDMFNRDDKYARLFEGGTVYQAFLSPSDFHRWHSPVKGTILDIVLVEGTYYAVLPDAGAEQGDPELAERDPRGALIRSQPFLTIEATRVLIYIQSEDINIGTVCFIGVGMAEVSTCQMRVKKGQQVEPGTELGMFHFGGSSHALVFPKTTKFEEEPGVQVGNHIWINSTLGQATYMPVSE